ncbi:MAG: hypothetical protein SWY16_09650 [Cyanobacteriota bacterium]|nr:hypothetical protein [Cyanobacteriota bacterium]
MKSIRWIGCEEAEVELSNDNDNEEQTILAFCHPCTLKLGDRVNQPLEAFDTGIIVISQIENVVIEKQTGFSYRIIAKSIDISARIVDACGILIRLPKLPYLCHVGEFLEFYVERLDLV